MKEQLVSAIIAKMAKKRGFDWKCESLYNTKYHKDVLECVMLENWNNTPHLISAPTQALLQKWLRDEHKIFVYCVPHGFKKGNGRSTIRWTNNIIIRKNKYCTTYEKALELGLKEALKLIK